MHVVVLYLKSTKKISVGYEKLIIGAPFTQQVQLCCTMNFKRFWPILCSKFNRILHFFVAGPPLDVAKFRGPGPWPYELGQGDSVSRYDSHILWRNPKRVIFNRPPPFSCHLVSWNFSASQRRGCIMYYGSWITEPGLQAFVPLYPLATLGVAPRDHSKSNHYSYLLLTSP